MSPGLPPAAGRALDEGTLCYLAVRTVHGPHLTPLVYAAEGGRLWVTTSRSSVKARTWRVDPTLAGLVRSGDVSVSFRGEVRTYDGLDPLTWPSIAFGGPRLIRAALRFTAKNARFFAGYAVDAPRVPFAWTLPGRLFAGIDPTAGWVSLGDGVSLLGSWGDSPARPARYRSVFRPALEPIRFDRRFPRDVQTALGRHGPGTIAVEAGAGLAVLPVTWSRVAGTGSYHALIASSLLETSGVVSGTRGALTIDRASAWRAVEMAGMLLQGSVEAFSTKATTRGRTELRRVIEDHLRKGPAAPGGFGAGSVDPDAMALIRLRPSRVVWWRGWTSGTVRAR